jgi:hypothetical protein
MTQIESVELHKQSYFQIHFIRNKNMFYCNSVCRVRVSVLRPYF